MRLKIFWLVGLMAVVLIQAPGQPPSGMAQDFRGSSSQDNSKAERNERERHEKFDRYSEGGGVWDRSRLNDPKDVKRFDEMAQKLGSANSAITRQQYLDYYQQREQGSGSSRKSFNGSPMVFSTSTNAPAVPASAATGMEGQSRSSFGGSGGLSSWTDRAFRQYDRNGDGMLNNDEIPETMRNERAQWDTNGDGLIDPNEYTSYSQARMQQMQAERTSNGSTTSGGLGRPSSSNGSSPTNPSSSVMGMSRGALDMGSMRGLDRGGTSSSRQRDSDPAPRATVYRAGNLPRELPSWFAQRDTDNDGQVALYEWRASGSSLSDFQQFDGNNDGFVTVEEVLRDQAAKQRNGSTAGTAVASTNMGDTGGRGSFGSRGSSRGGSTPSFDFSSLRPGGDGLDPERMMEMMSRARESSLRNGGAPSTPADFIREMTGSSPSPSGDRGSSRRSRGWGGGDR